MSQADFEAALKEPAVQETLKNGKPLMMSPKSREFQPMSLMVST